jgi:hypothetical protein
MTLVDELCHPALHWGHQVEVRSNFDGGWHRGFEIANVRVGEVGVVGYTLRRLSDGTVLSELIPMEDIRDAAVPVLAGHSKR